ncbi:MAG TPA: hypothetical protein VIK39_06905 [Candidatus Angelobacter sp.]
MIPLAVNEYVPAAVALAAVVTVKVEEVPVTGFELKVPLAPVGRPIALKKTAPVNPPVRVTVTVYVVLAPAVTVLEPGDIETVKLPLAAA